MEKDSNKEILLDKDEIIQDLRKTFSAELCQAIQSEDTKTEDKLKRYLLEHYGRSKPSVCIHTELALCEEELTEIIACIRKELRRRPVDD